MLTDEQVAAIRLKAVELSDAGDVPDELFSVIGDAGFVLIGEASHGTREFYECRAEITKRLVESKGFNAVAVEADFPDAYRVNRYVNGSGPDESADDALGDFKRFPLWMWRNPVVADFVEWLRAHNERKPANRRTGFFGIDLYSLHASVDAVLSYLDKTDPEAAGRARFRYSCFEAFGEDPQHYGYAASFDLSRSCEDEAVRELNELQRRAADYLDRDGFIARDEYFFAEQNARLVRNAEEYYREMFRGRVSSWNLRDRHMTETIVALAAHIETLGQTPKIVVWAHNSHLGDASATEIGERGEWNVGQLMRQKFPDKTVNIGFTTYTGTVTAATNWDEPAQLKRVNEGLPGSIESLFHETGKRNFFVDLRATALHEALRDPILERAVGVIYRPESERASHYFYAVLPRQFNGMIHFDITTGLEPLDRVASWSHEDAPETYPEGL